MKKYRITDPKSGKTITVSGDHAPTQEDAAAIIARAVSSDAVSESAPPPKSGLQRIRGAIGKSWAEREKRAGEAIQRSADTYVSDFTGAPIVASGDRQTLTEGFVQAGGEAVGAVLDPLLIPLGMLGKHYLDKALIPREQQMLAGFVAPAVGAVVQATPKRMQRDIGAFGNLSMLIPGVTGARPIVGAAEGAVERVAGATGAAMKKEAGTVLQRNIVPRPSVVRNEKLDPQNLLKHGVAGSPAKSLDKIDALFEKTENNIQSMLTKAQEASPTASINKNASIADFKTKVMKHEIPTLQEPSAEELALKYADELSQAIDNHIKPGEYGDMTLPQANEAKRFVWKKAFKKGIAPTEQTNIKEQVWDYVGLYIMKQLEEKVPGIREQNQVFKELLPWQKEIKYRMEGPKRSGLPLKLTEVVMGGGIGSALGSSSGNMGLGALGFAAGVGVIHASQSPTVARALYSTGKLLESVGGPTGKNTLSTIIPRAPTKPFAEVAPSLVPSAGVSGGAMTAEELYRRKHGNQKLSFLTRRKK